MTDEANDNGGAPIAHIPYDPDDRAFFGARGVIEREWDYVQRRPDRPKQYEDHKPWSGLAISGGGIRSASFSLGVLQALAKHDLLSHFDYLSTVSGGGYIGTSLTWLLHRGWKLDPAHDKGEERLLERLRASQSPTLEGFGIRFSTDSKRFPYGTHGPDADLKEGGGWAGASLLRYLRQRGNYLTPGQGVNALALAAVVLRGILLNLSLLLPGLVLGFVLVLLALSQLPGAPSLSAISFAFAGVLAVLFVLNLSMLALESAGEGDRSGRRSHKGLLILANILSLPFGFVGKGSGASQTDSRLHAFAADFFALPWFKGATQDEREPVLYRRRRRYDICFARILGLQLFALLLGSIPLIYTLLSDAFVASGAGAGAAGAGAAGAFSTIAGYAAALLGYLRAASAKGAPPKFVAGAAAALILYGQLLVSYAIASELAAGLSLPEAASWAPFGISLFAEVLSPIGAIVGIAAVFALALVVAFCANLNYLSIHRYYRDRLMEALMPDVTKVLGGTGWRAYSADRVYMKDVCRYPERGQTVDPGVHSHGPYHLINCNVVLTSSGIPKFRGRGGDNFILSHLYSGCNATGWCPTDRYRNGQVTLASAMATSGAAINPNTGVGGEGVTRSKLLSMVLGMLNLRLGLWLPNPRGEDARAQRASPNYVKPNITSIFGHGLDESRRLLQLTDGGHFENLALYELIRRRLRLILVIDAGADSKYGFGDFANLQEKVRVDFGVDIRIDLRPLLPSTDIALLRKRADQPFSGMIAEKGYAIGDIRYGDGSVGTLVLIKTTLTDRLSGDIYGYAHENPDFPDQPTGDQFFDEKQFEAYRMLGVQLAEQALGAEDFEKAWADAAQGEK